MIELLWDKSFTRTLKKLWDFVNATVKFEVLQNRQVIIEREFLTHIADPLTQRTTTKILALS